MDRVIRPEHRLLSSLSPTAPVAECYRVLRTNLRFLDVEKPVRTVLVTSALPKEGKTLTACNLAIALAETGSPVVLLDADLRKSSLHRMLHLDNRVGLTTLLTGEVTVGRALQATHISNLKAITAGPKPPNPAELLGSPRMSQVLAELGQQAACIVADSPPVMPLSDAIVLAGLMDGVILVLRVGQTAYQVAQRAKAALEQVKARLLGVVLNYVSPDGLSQYSYFYHDGGEDTPNGTRRRTRKKGHHASY